MNNDLETVIEDATTDALDTNEPVDDTPADDGVEAADASTDVAVSDTTDDAAAEPAEGSTDQVAAPGTAADPNAPAAQDDFAKRFGLQANSVTGRENRIPYSRVKKIVEKNERETAAKVKKEVEAAFQPKLTEFETKVKTYEDRLGKVAQFEHILENDPRTFLSMLAKVPAYKEFFDYVGKMATGNAQPQQPTADPNADMPQPDQELSDGSRVYSMEGLKSLLAWQAKQVEERVTQQVQQRYAPIEQEWQSREHMARIVPVIEKQIADARTWPQFNENEPAIVAALKADQNLSLEGAYRQVVFPKLVADRNKIRTEVMAEIQRKPTSSSAPARPTKPAAASGGHRSLEDIIAEAASGLK